MTISSKVCIGGMVRKLCTTQQIEKNSLSLELIVAILLIGSYSLRPKKQARPAPPRQPHGGRGTDRVRTAQFALGLSENY